MRSFAIITVTTMITIIATTTTTTTIIIFATLPMSAISTIIAISGPKVEGTRVWL